MIIERWSCFFDFSDVWGELLVRGRLPAAAARLQIRFFPWSNNAIICGFGDPFELFASLWSIFLHLLLQIANIFLYLFPSLLLFLLQAFSELSFLILTILCLIFPLLSLHCLFGFVDFIPSFQFVPGELLEDGLLHLCIFSFVFSVENKIQLIFLIDDLALIQLLQFPCSSLVDLLNEILLVPIFHHLPILLIIFFGDDWSWNTILLLFYFLLSPLLSKSDLFF